MFPSLCLLFFAFPFGLFGFFVHFIICSLWLLLKGSCAVHDVICEVHESSPKVLERSIVVRVDS